MLPLLALCGAVLGGILAACLVEHIGQNLCYPIPMDERRKARFNFYIALSSVGVVGLWVAVVMVTAVVLRGSDDVTIVSILVVASVFLSGFAVAFVLAAILARRCFK